MLAKKIAIIDSKPNRNNYAEYFDNKFDFDLYHLASDATLKRILKKNVDIEIDLEAYDWVILVGADACKHYLKNVSVTDHSGKLVNEKFIPVINPAMVSFKPETERLWQDSRNNIIDIVTGVAKTVNLKSKVVGIQTEKEALKFFNEALASKNPFFALDCETSSLYPRDGYVLGISVSFRKDYGAYISADCITDEVSAKMQELIDKKTVIFHNAKFDMPFLSYHFGWVFKKFEDTMLLHYCLEENPGTHGLKQLAIKYTDYGDYEREMYDWIDSYKKAHGILKENFTFDLIPFEIMYKYAAIDAIVTFLIYLQIKPAVDKNTKLKKVYNGILIPASLFLMDVQDNGVPFDKSRLDFSQRILSDEIVEASAKLYADSRIGEFEKYQGKEFNPGSVMQLRSLLFDFLKIPPTGKRTDGGEYSTDAEVLQELAEFHEIPQHILDVRKLNKIKNTYIDKIIPQLNRDSRLRTNFNIHGTTSGRLSSSGKLNMQQLPRDEPAVKVCIKAKPGHKIVSMDLTTAEVYVVAVLSGDQKMMDIFRSGGDFHSAIAKQVFHLDCEVSEVKSLYPLLRQAAKSTTFGIKV